jgi:predicted small lipoprotein YifL
MLVRVTAKGICMAIATAALCLGLAACGVRGSLDPPPHAKATGTAKSAEASGTQPASAAPPKPHEDFFLDRLLR